jgi:hypothetical protein
MQELKRLATLHPVSFALLVSLMVLLAYMAAAIPAQTVADNRAAYELVEAVGRAAASLFFLYVLWKFGWLGCAGVTTRGALSAWVITLLVLAYGLITSTYALFGSVAVRDISDSVLSGAVAANAMMTGVIEEIPFRGIILYAFVQAWGHSKRGVVKGILYSSLLFGGIHVIHVLLGRPLPQAILVSAGATLSGIFYAAFVLRRKTIWTVVVIHGVVNAVVALRVLETPGFAELVPALGLATLLHLPLVVYGAYLMFRLPPQTSTTRAA